MPVCVDLTHPLIILHSPPYPLSSLTPFIIITHPLIIITHPLIIHSQALHCCGAIAAQKDLKLQLLMDPMLPKHVVADPVRISQVLVNLLSNAVKVLYIYIYTLPYKSYKSLITPI